MDLNTEFSKFNCISLNYFQRNSTEILEYSSESEKEDDSENVLFIDSDSSHMDFGSDGRQNVETLINPTVKSTETILYTPQKQSKFSRTPENSAKKKLLRLNHTFLNTFMDVPNSGCDLWNYSFTVSVVTSLLDCFS